MGKLKVGVVSYGSRGAAVADAFYRSPQKPEVYIFSKQANPMNFDIALRTGGKQVVGDLGDVEALAGFFEEADVDFVFPGPEKPIIAGLNNRLRGKIPVLCPGTEYALEASKVDQRKWLEDSYPEANPWFRVFRRGKYYDKEVKAWLEECNCQVAIKPDTPTAGKGVGVAEDHFEPTVDGAFAYFKEVVRDSENVIIESRVDGEESSFMAFSDGAHLLAMPDVRDYKRAFTGDKGPNTGGMGSYCDARPWLPFMTRDERKEERHITEGLFEEMKHGRMVRLDERCTGIPFYMAFMHTGRGSKVLEVNSRGGDPELMNVLSLMESDFVELCQDMVRGELDPDSLVFRPQASVVTYLVPPAYGGRNPNNPPVMEVDLMAAMRLVLESPDKYRLYPGDMARQDGKTYALKSRAVACVGVGDDIASARERSLQLVDAVGTEHLWYRDDIASPEHIGRSKKHMEDLRSGV